MLVWGEGNVGFANLVLYSESGKALAGSFFIFFPFKTEGAYVFPFLPSANAYHNLLGAVLGWGDGVVASLSLRTQVLDETANVSAGAEDTLRTQSPGRQRPSVIPVPY